jgi:hypothetical protein
MPRFSDAGLDELERKASDAAGLSKLLANEHRLLILCRLAVKREMSFQSRRSRGFEPIRAVSAISLGCVRKGWSDYLLPHS